MKHKATSSLLILLITGLLTANLLADSRDDDIAAITDVIQRSYFNGASNDLDTESMREGFHPGFAMLTPEGNKLKIHSIEEWIENTEKWKASPDYDKEKAKADCKIVSLDVTGVCAFAKTEERQKGELKYTAYLSLLKFENGWKIVTKTYHKHD